MGYMGILIQDNPKPYSIYLIKGDCTIKGFGVPSWTSSLEVCMFELLNWLC